MAELDSTISERRLLDLAGLAALLGCLKADGRTLVGPCVRDGAIIYDTIQGIDDLPRGMTDEQEAGRYRLASRADGALFGYAVGPHSWKKLFLRPALTLLRARLEGSSMMVESAPVESPPLALIGARACDLAALAIQDRIFRDGAMVDEDYAARRRDVVIVAVSCGTAGGTCFCVSMGTGPRCRTGFDIALVELVDAQRHRFLAEAGSPAGSALLARIPTSDADAATEGAATAVVERTAASMGRTLETDGIRELLYGNLEHPRWDDAASRCLSCTNCTMVCPTCFCLTVEDVSDLAGTSVDRVRRWDSCFTLDHSHVHGGSVRASVKSRYRQWVTHKLAAWIDQFGTSGCVGCGRCITWCPAAIDITAEAAAIRGTPAGAGEA